MKKNILILTLLILGFSSCRKYNSQDVLPTATGALFDLAIFGDPKVWNDTIGKKMMEIFDDDTPGLPQSEPLFSVTFFPETNLDRTMSLSRNMICFRVDPTTYTKGTISFQRNKWAKIQAVVRMTAPDQETLVKELEKNKQTIIDFFVDIEHERSIQYYRRYSNEMSSRLIYDSVGVRLVIPDFLNKSKGAKNFAWLSNANEVSRQDIVAYRVPYRSEADFSLERLLAVRDSVMKRNIPGPSEGSYMSTEMDNYPPVSRAMIVDSVYCVEVRGLWRVEGDFMGGPFVSRSYYDQAHNDIVTVEAFVYSPREKKRNKMRLTEAITTSVKFE